jgi:hypothetical protein
MSKQIQRQTVPLEDVETLHTVDDYSNAELIGFVVRRLRESSPTAATALALTKLREACLWLDSDATRKLP